MEGSPVLEVVEAPLDAEDAIRANAPLPDALPVLPLRETVTFPDTMTPLAVGQERSIKLVNDVLGANRMLVMVASRDPENEEPGPDDLYEVGVVGVVARMMKIPDGTIRILVQGAQRVRLGPYVAEEPYLVARISELPDASRREPGAGGADPQRAAHLLRDHRADPVPARGAADGGRQHRRPRGPRAT